MKEKYNMKKVLSELVNKRRIVLSGNLDTGDLIKIKESARLYGIRFVVYQQKICGNLHFIIQVIGKIPAETKNAIQNPPPVAA